jgi:hypothetical protein
LSDILLNMRPLGVKLLGHQLLIWVILFIPKTSWIHFITDSDCQGVDWTEFIHQFGHFLMNKIQKYYKTLSII